MPIDPNIALAGQPVANPLDQYGKVLQLKNLAQQGQLGQQQLQSGQLQLQQQQQQMNDQKAIRQAFADSQGDSSQILPAAVKNGVSGAGLLNLQKSIMTMREQVAKTSKAELDNQSLKNGQIAGAIQTLMGDPSNLAQNLPVAVANLVKGGYLDPQTASQIDIPHLTQMGNGDPMQGLKFYYGTLQTANDLASQAEKQSTIAKNTAQAVEANAKTPGDKAESAIKQLTAAAQTSTLVNDQPSWDAWRATLDPAIAAKVPAMYSPAAKGLVQRAGLSPDQQITADQSAANAAETHRHNLTSESIARLNAAVNEGRLQQEKVINGMKYGPGTQEYWAKQLQENPDSIKEMPPELRSSVGQMFRAQTGLPLPTPLSGTGQTQETAARNALDGVTFIRKAMQNPEIRANIGPILGRLGSAEQAVGTAVGLSPQAEALAQELRTRMRYFVYQEGKAVLGGRLPQQLMQQLESSSANVNMDPAMLSGALKGAEDNANSVLDNNDKQRFGGQMRPRAMRAGGADANVPGYQKVAVGPNGHKIGYNGKNWVDITTGKALQ